MKTFAKIVFGVFLGVLVLIGITRPVIAQVVVKVELTQQEPAPPNGNGWISVKVDPWRAIIEPSETRLKWECKLGTGPMRCRIKFNWPKAFPQDEIEGENPETGDIDPNAPRHVYFYTIIIPRPGGGKPIQIDPEYERR